MLFVFNPAQTLLLNSGYSTSHSLNQEDNASHKHNIAFLQPNQVKKAKNGFKKKFKPRTRSNEHSYVESDIRFLFPFQTEYWNRTCVQRKLWNVEDKPNSSDSVLRGVISELVHQSFLFFITIKWIKEEVNILSPTFS